MIFQGDLSKYHPADALMFLSQLSLDGVLSVAGGERVLTLAFEGGFLIDAQSAAGDDKLLRLLRCEKQIDAGTEGRIRRIRSETGMAVRQILGELDLVPLEAIKPILETAIKEVLLELFLLEAGHFHFTDTHVDSDGAGIRLDSGAISIKSLSQADDWRNFEKTIITLERGIGWRTPDDIPAQLSAAERSLARLASRPLIVQRLLALAPMGSHAALRIVEKHLENGSFYLLPVPDGATSAPSPSDGQLDPIFVAYKRALKSLIRANDVLKKVEAVIGFCKKYYRGILLLTARQGQVIHCKTITIDQHGAMQQQSRKGDLGAIGADPVFAAVLRSGVGFFGKVFPSTLIDGLAAVPDAGECALLPILDQPPLAMFFYAYTETAYKGLSPHHYLELLSWMVTPAGKAAGTAVTAPTPGPPQPSAAKPMVDPSPKGASAMVRLVEQIEDLPPLPALAARTLELLGDPDASIAEIERTIAQDQALVAKMIKVGNSALYGGLQKVGTLRQALTRLGAKTTKSLVLAASTRGYFVKDSKGMRAWGPALWQHSLESGLAARRVAAVVGGADPEQAFIAGIMHDIGKLVILMLDEAQYKKVQQVKIAATLSDCEAETQVLGVDHARLGHRLMEKWHMPEPVGGCTRDHHRWAEAGDGRRLVAIVAYGNHLSHTLGNRPQPETPETQQFIDALRHALALSDQAHADIVARVAADIQNADLLG